MRTLAFLLLAAALAVPTCARARVKPWLSLEGQWSTYSMKDVNSFIREVNREMADGGVASSMDEVKYGLGYGGALGLDLAGPLSLGIGYERLTATTGMSPLGTYDYPGNAVRGFVEYRLPLGKDSHALLGAAGGVVSEAGSYDFTMPWVTEYIKLTGSGPLFEIYAGSSVWATPHFGLTGSFGYRQAKIGEVKGQVAGVTQTLTNYDGSKFTTDYSGIFARVGMKIAFKK